MASEVERAPRWAPLATLPFAVAGLGVATYLTYVHYAEPTALSCPDTGVVNCTKVTTSAESMLFGHIPVALTGALFFLVMTALTIPPAWRARARAVTALRLAGVVGGMGMVVWLIYAEAFRIKALCLWCTGVHVLTFLLFVGVLAATLLRPLDEP